MNDEPIFIAGPDRSGTTLIFALLASHPRISMVRRTNMWRYFHRQYGDLSQPDNFERCLDHMVRYNRMRHLQPDPERIRREFWQGKPTYGRLFTLIHQHNAERVGKPRWGDKSLHTEHYVDRVIGEFPNARIIHMTRDPRDRYASVRKRHGNDIPRLGATTGRWLYSMKVAKRNLDQFPENYMILQFEELASNPEGTLRQVCAFIHEEFTPAMLTMEGVSNYRDRGGNSSFGRIEPGIISTRPIGRYRTVLSSFEIAFIQIFSGRYMEAMGYQLEPFQLSSNERVLFYTQVLPINVVRMAGWITLNAIDIKRGVRVPEFRLLDNP